MLNKAIALTCLLFTSVTATAATVWEPTDVLQNGTVNIINFEIRPAFSLNGGSLALFEDTDALNAANALVLGGGGGEFRFTDSGGGTFTVESWVNDVWTGNSITMTGFEFVLAVDWTGTGAGYVSDSNAGQAGGDPTSWYIEFDDGVNSGHTLAVDLRPVPLPAAAWLFGSALLGLAGVARRRPAV